VGKVRTRKETGKLQLDFNYLNIRCREQTNLLDTPHNRKKVEMLMERIEAEITLGTFNYAKYFPTSPRVKVIDVVKGKISERRALAPAFSVFAQLWFNELEVSWRTSYRQTIEFMIFKRFIPYFGQSPIDEIRRADLLDFRLFLTKQEGRKGNRLSNNTINRHIKILNSILNEAAARYDFTAPGSSIKSLKTEKKDVDPFTLDEINLIINHVRADFRDYYITRFFTGMRSGEIHGLKWRYVDFERRLILIRETHTRTGTEYTKTDSSQREIQMSQIVLDALRCQHASTGHLDLVFCTANGNALNNNNLTKRVWYPLLRHLGLRLRRPYETRHTAATLWLASGENAEWVARQMGHATTEMLFRVYSRFIPNVTRQDGSAFETLILSQITTHKDGNNDE
jgi:integrase